MKKKLPDFIKNHVLVAFYRDRDTRSLKRAYNNQSDSEQDLQEKLQSPERERNDSVYVTDDVVVVYAPEQAQGVTSLDPSLKPEVPEGLEGPLTFDDLDFGVPEENGPGEWQMHRPMLDIDFPAELIPSSTEGHFHLYLDKPMTWKKYKRLLNALAEAGVIEHGYASASVSRGYSSLRLPWVKKEVKK